MSCKIRRCNFKPHFQRDFLACCTKPVSVHLVMACVSCSLNSFSVFLLSLKQQQNLTKIMFSCIHFPAWPYPPKIMGKKEEYFKLFGLTGKIFPPTCSLKGNALQQLWIPSWGYSDCCLSNFPIKVGKLEFRHDIPWHPLQAEQARHSCSYRHWRYMHWLWSGTCVSYNQSIKAMMPKPKCYFLFCLLKLNQFVAMLRK